MTDATERSPGTHGCRDDDPMGKSIDRCAAFLADMVALCRKHRVLLTLDEYDDVAFEEQPLPTQGFGFISLIGDVEESVRLALWDEFHGVRSER